MRMLRTSFPPLRAHQHCIISPFPPSLPPSLLLPHTGTPSYDAALLHQSLLWAGGFLLYAFLAHLSSPSSSSGLTSSLLHSLSSSSSSSYSPSSSSVLASRLDELTGGGGGGAGGSELTPFLLLQHLKARLAGLSSLLTLLLLPSLLLLPFPAVSSFLSSLPPFFHGTLPSLTLSLQRLLPSLPPSLLSFLQTRLGPERYASLSSLSFSTPSLPYTATHLLLSLSLLSLLFLLASSSFFVPEAWVKTPPSPSSSLPPSLHPSLPRSLLSELTRLLHDQSSISEAAEINYRDLKPALAAKRASLLRSLPPAFPASLLKDGARKVGGMVALVVWQLQSAFLLLSLLAFLLWAVRDLNLSVGGGGMEGGRGGGREWVWLVGGVGMMLWEGVREGRAAAREAMVWSQVEGRGVLGGLYRALGAEGGGRKEGGRKEGGREEGGREGRGWTTDGPAPQEGLKMEGVWVRKQGGREGGRASEDAYILKDISLQARPGEILLVCGSEGAGKSALLRALASPLSPSRLRGLMSLQGRRVGEWEREAWREGVAFLPGVEESACFPCWTIGENVCPFSLLVPNEGAGEREVWQKAGRRAGGVDGWVEGWREGWFTELGGGEEGEGRSLSGGEWRRVQLARALAWGGGEGGRGGGRGPPRLVVLDEPTLLMSDEEAKKFVGRLRETMRREWGNPVVVIGTQRPTLGKYVDKMLVLQEGRVVQTGTPSQVLPSPLLEGGREGGQGQGTVPPLWLPSTGAGREGGGRGGGGGGRRPVQWGGGRKTDSDGEDDIYIFDR